MYKIVICDDDKNFISYMKEMLLRCDLSERIGFRCVADLSVLKAYARKALERRLEKSKRWNVEGNKATLKWNY